MAQAFVILAAILALFACIGCISYNAAATVAGLTKGAK